MSQEARKYLERFLLDESFRDLTTTDPDAAFAQFNLSEQEKDIIRRREPEIANLMEESEEQPVEGMSQHFASQPLGVDPTAPDSGTHQSKAARLGIIRTVGTIRLPPNKSPMVAAHLLPSATPPSDVFGTAYGMSQGFYPAYMPMMVLVPVPLGFPALYPPMPQFPPAPPPNASSSQSSGPAGATSSPTSSGTGARSAAVSARSSAGEQRFRALLDLIRQLESI